jgi:G:T-mismatch repair DNA endonuclease (very short patch repair protein)
MKESHKGKIPWNKGLTKETDSRVEAISNSLKGNQSNIGHICSQETKDKIGLRNKGIKHDEAFSQMCVDRQKKLCKDPKYIEMRIEAMLKANIEIRPNKPEKKVMSIVEQEFLDFKYTGDGSFWIQGKNPDFITVKGRKQIIEVLGCYWHGCLEHFPDEKKYKEFEDRVRLFKSYGYSTLGIWEHELKHPEKVIERIQEFVER